MPNLVSYFNRHPSLSYFFAPRSIGSSSQSPRPDERTRESFEELRVALALLARVQRPNPETIWSSLAPFLADPAGNTHRTEINAVKRTRPLELVDWGKELHDRFSLPFYLRRDLSTVLSELSETGFGLGPSIVERLLNDEDRHTGTAEFQGCRLTLKRAVEFWPLVGDDAMHQDRDASRLVDASSEDCCLDLRIL